jgi:hypothetical protein
MDLARIKELRYSQGGRDSSMTCSEAQGPSPLSEDDCVGVGGCVCENVCLISDGSRFGATWPKLGVVALPSKVDLRDTTEHLTKSEHDWFVLVRGQRYLS